MEDLTSDPSRLIPLSQVGAPLENTFEVWERLLTIFAMMVATRKTEEGASPQKER